MKTIFLCLAGLLCINQAMAQCATAQAPSLIQPTSPVCAGSSAISINTVSGSYTSLTWQQSVNGGGWTNISGGGYFTPSTTGTYKFRVDAYCSNGINSSNDLSNEVTIVVSNAQAGTITGGSSNICVGSSVGTLTVSGTVGTINWQYSLNGAGFSTDYSATGQTTYSPSPSVSGEYKYRVQTTCYSGSPDYSNEVEVNVNTPIQAAICDDDDDLRRCVVQIKVPNVIPYEFSGFLINRTDNSGRLLILTTSQPFIRYGYSNLGAAIFKWDVDIVQCNNPTAATSKITTGCTHLVTDGFFTLLELDAPPDLPELYYMGWELSQSAESCIFQSSTSTIKKAKVTTGTPTSGSSAVAVSIDPYTGDNNYTESFGSGALKVTEWEDGNMQQRGRGAPFINASSKAIGIYVIGNEASCNNGPSYFADLYSATSNLLNYLRNSSSETNSATVHMNYCKPTENLFGSLNQDKQYKVSESIVSTQNIFDGYSVRYKAGTYIELNNGFVSGNNFVAEIDPCVSIVTVIAAKTDDVIEQPQTVSDFNTPLNGIKIYPTILANGNTINIETLQPTQNLHVSIYDLQGKIVQKQSIPELNAHEPYSIFISNLSSGFYTVSAGNNTIFSTQKIIIQ